MGKLPLTHIYSNIGTVSYYLPKYLAKILLPLSQSEYTANSTKEFICELKCLKPFGNNFKLFPLMCHYCLQMFPLTTLLIPPCVEFMLNMKEKLRCL